MCLVVLCHYYGPICVNANLPFIMGGMVSARTQGARIPHLSHFHHGGIRSALGSEVRVPDLLSDHWLSGKAPPCSPTPPPGRHCEISLHCQVFLVPSLMIVAVFLLQWYSPITHYFQFWLFLISSFLCLSFTLLLMTVMPPWVFSGLCKAFSSPSFIPPT